MKRCPACGTRHNDDLLVVCPECGAAFDEQPSFSDADISAIEGRILNRVTRKVGKFIFGGFSLLTIASVITLIWQFGTLWNVGISRLQTSLNKRIDGEFRTERIQKSITNVAEAQAAALLRDSVQPKI